MSDFLYLLLQQIVNTKDFQKKNTNIKRQQVNSSDQILFQQN